MYKAAFRPNQAMREKGQPSHLFEWGSAFNLQGLKGDRTGLSKEMQRSDIIWKTLPWPIAQVDDQTEGKEKKLSQI